MSLVARGHRGSGTGGRAAGAGKAASGIKRAVRPRLWQAVAALVAALCCVLLVCWLSHSPGYSGSIGISEGPAHGSEDLPAPSAGADASLQSGEGLGIGAHSSASGTPQGQEVWLTADALLAQLAQAVAVEGSAQAAATLPEEVPDAASALLEAYRGGGGSILAYEGYLDLSGDAWGCVVEGEGWVDVGVVQARSEGGSQASVTRMFVDAWAEDPDALLGEVLDGG